MNIDVEREINNNLVKGIEVLKKDLENKEKEFENIVKIGRNNIMDEVNMKLGKDLSGYEKKMKYGIDSVKDKMKRMYKLEMGGKEVGNGINKRIGFDEKCERKISEIKGIKFVKEKKKFEDMEDND
jgi:fumarate hydratase class II